MSSIFGGSKQKSTNTQESNSSSTSNSYNRGYDAISSAMSPVMGSAAQGANGLQALLSGDSSQFDAFKQATGFDQMAKAGGQGITGGAAAKGMLRSGSTGKALASFGTGLQNQFASSFMDKLLQQAGLGMQAGSLISGAGNVSNSSSQSNSTGTSTSSGKSKPGIGGLVGSLMTGGVM